MLLSCRFLLILLCVGSAVALPHSMITGQVQQLGDKLKSVFQNDVKYKEISKFYQNVSTVQIHTQTLNGAKEVIRLSDELSQNIDEVLQMMETNSQLIETVYDKSITQSNKYKSCCQQHFTAAYDSRFNETVDSKQICTSSYSINSQTRDFTTVLKNLQSNIGRHPAVLWQYTGDVNGSYYQYPTAARLCSSPKSSNDFRFKNWYVSTAVPKQKNIVTVVDESYSMKLAINSSHRPFLPKNNTKCVFIPGHPLCPNLLKYAKIAAKTVVDTLNANDWANVIAFSNVPRDPRGCFGDKVAQAHNRNKNTFFKFLNDIKPVRPKGGGQGTFYNSSFQEAFDMLYNAKVQNPDHFKDSVDLILFLTDGDPSDLYPDIRSVIAKGNHRMNGSVHIFFYRLGAFGNKDANMLSLPDQGNMKLRYKNYNPAAWNQKHNPPVGPPGYFNALTGDRVKNLREIMGSYYLQFPHSKRYSAKFNLPHMSRKTGMVTTVTQPIYDSNNKFIGVTAIDVHFNTLLKDIISYRHGRFSYAFLLDHNGKVLVHPNYPQMNNVLKTQVNFLDLQYAEPALNGTIIEQMKKQDSGHYRTQVDLAVSRGVSQQDGSVSLFLNTTYYWKSVDNSSYTVVFVLFDPDIHMIQRSLAANSTAPPPSSSSNKADVCQSNGAVFYRNGTKVQASYGNVNDTDSAVVNSIQYKYWRRAPVHVNYRFMGLENGYFQVVPGIGLSPGFSTVSQPWYKVSLSFMKDLAVTRAGYGATADPELLTLTRPVFDNQNSLVGVVGGSVHRNLINYYLDDIVKVCQQPSVGCTLLDHSGYEVLDAALNQGTGWKHSHITETQPEVVNLLTNQHQRNVQALWCRQTHGLESAQMFYNVNMKDKEYVENIDNSTCIDYGLYSLNGTNLFLLVSSNSSCSQNSIFVRPSNTCMCNDTCGTCGIKSNRCQCPCQCVIGSDDCENAFNVTFPTMQCPAPWIRPQPISLPSQNSSIPPCTPVCSSWNVTTCSSTCGWVASKNLVSGGICLPKPDTPTTTASATSTTTTSATPTTQPATTTTTAMCPNLRGQTLVSVLVNGAGKGKSKCGVKLEEFCSQHCFVGSISSEPCAVKRDSDVGIGLGVPLGLMSALAAGALIALAMKKAPVAPVAELKEMDPVESFSPNIYRASMGDALTHSTGQEGAQLDTWNGLGDGVFGRHTPN